MADIINGTYEIIEEIGKGSSGTVYKAFHLRLKKNVVLKKIRSDVSVAGYRNEVDLLKRIKHTYLPQVYDYFEYNDEIYTVFDYVEGENLQQYQNDRPLNEKEVYKFSVQLLEAVHHLHKQKPPIIHGDIKPSNIMVTGNNDICLIDFNVSFAINGNAAVIGGTKGYAAPEQMAYISDYANSSSLRSASRSRTRTTRRYNGIITEKSDIYSVGAVMYYMLSGVRPEADHNELVPLSEYGLSSSEELVAVVEKAMALKPSERYESIDGMLEALNGTDKKKAQRRKNTLTWLLVSVVCIGLAAGAGIFAKRYIQDKNQASVEEYNEIMAEIDKCIDGGDFDNAEAKISEAFGLSKEIPDMYYEKLRLYYEKEEYADCIEYYKNNKNYLFEKEYENKMNTFYYIGMAHFYSVDYKKEISEDDKTHFSDALFFFEEIKNNYNNRPDVYVNLAVIHERLKAYNDRNSVMEEARSKNISDEYILLAEGEIAIYSSSYDDAIGKLKASFEKAEDEYLKKRILSDVIVIYSENLDFEGDFESDISYLEESIKRVSRRYQPALKSNLAIALYNRGKDELCIKYCKEAIELNVNNFDIYISLIDSYYSSDMYSELLSYFEPIYEELSNSDNYYFILKRMSEASCQLYNTSAEVEKEEFKLKANKYYDLCKESSRKLKLQYNDGFEEEMAVLDENIRILNQ